MAASSSALAASSLAIASLIGRSIDASRRSISWRSGSSAAASRRCCSASRRRSWRESPSSAPPAWRSLSSAALRYAFCRRSSSLRRSRRPRRCASSCASSFWASSTMRSASASLVLRSRSTSTNLEFSSTLRASTSLCSRVSCATRSSAELIAAFSPANTRPSTFAVRATPPSAPSTWSSASVSFLMSAPSSRIAPRRCQRARANRIV